MPITNISIETSSILAGYNAEWLGFGKEPETGFSVEFYAKIEKYNPISFQEVEKKYFLLKIFTHIHGTLKGKGKTEIYTETNFLIEGTDLDKKSSEDIKQYATMYYLAYYNAGKDFAKIESSPIEYRRMKLINANDILEAIKSGAIILPAVGNV